MNDVHVSDVSSGQMHLGIRLLVLPRCGAYLLDDERQSQAMQTSNLMVLSGDEQNDARPYVPCSAQHSTAQSACILDSIIHTACAA